MPTTAELTAEIQAVKAELAITKAELKKAQKDISILRTNRHERPGLVLFALNATKDFGERVAAALDMELSPHKERYHADQEIYVRPMINVRRKSCVVIQSLYGDNDESINDKLMKLLIFVSALKDASADEITCVIPKMGYDRSDRKCKSREAVITKLMAQQFELNIDRVMTTDIHNLGAYNNAFRNRADHLECRYEVAKAIAAGLSKYSPSDISVMSPDISGFKRCEDAARALTAQLGPGIGLAGLRKRRDEDHVDVDDHIIGDVRKVMILWDDVISTGSTMKLAIEKAHEGGAEVIYVVTSHGLFVGNANEHLTTPHLTKLVITDTVPPFRLNKELLAKTQTVSLAPMFAEAIRRTYTGESLSSLFN